MKNLTSRQVGDIWSVENDLRKGQKVWKVQMPKGVWTFKHKKDAEAAASII